MIIILTPFLHMKKLKLVIEKKVPVATGLFGVKGARLTMDDSFF